MTQKNSKIFLPKDRSEEYLRLRINDQSTFENLLVFPSYVYLDLVADCNASCRMCPLVHKKKRYMSKTLFDKSAQEIIKYKDFVKYVVVQGRGEPLLDPYICERVALFSEKNKIPTFLSTNAELLDEEKAEGLLRGRVSTIVLSIDSLNENVYQKIRRGLDFKKVLKNIHRFIELRDKLNPATQVRIRMIEQEPNQGEWPQFEAYWKPLLKPHDRLTVKKVHAWGGKLKLNEIKSVTTDQDHFPCVTLWSFFSILSDGSIPLCPGDGASGNYILGNFSDHSIKELWSNGDRNRFRQLHLGGSKEPSEMCTNCRMVEEPSDLEHIGRKVFPELYAGS